MKILPAIFKPSIFLSYAREDSTLAAELERELVQEGFVVFKDTKDIDPGDNFVTRLKRAIRSSSGLVALVTDSYSTSRWAQAELYHGHALNKTIVPVVPSGQQPPRLDEPLTRFLRDVQWVIGWGDDDSGFAIGNLGARLQSARVKHRKRLLAQAVGVVVPLVVFGFLAMWAVSNLNTRDRAARLASVIEEIASSTIVVSEERVTQWADIVSGDRQARAALLGIVQDRARMSTARMNALALAGHLVEGQFESRWYIENVDFQGSELKNVHLVDVTFRGGSWSNVSVKNAVLAGVVWTSEPPVVMSGSVFDGVEFNSVLMEAFVAIEVKFRNVKFRAGEIDITGFGKVLFGVPEEHGPDNPTITPSFTLFEGTTIRSGHKPPEPGVLDLSRPTDFTIFENVLFVRCRLEGWFDPAWFRNSSFEDCEFPDGLTPEALEASGNIVVEG